MRYIFPRCGILFLLSALVSPASAQFVDDFSDGNLTDAPAWSGQTDRFQVSGALELQLSDPDPQSANLSYLYADVPTSVDAETTWSFYFRQEFAPSGSNYGEVYLATNGSDLSAEPTGYFLRLGGISGSDDALELYRRDSDGEELLINGTPGALGSDPAQARVRVVRTPAGIWSLEADYSGGTDYQPEGTAEDVTYPLGNFFGLSCIYTSTRSDAFFFDDFLVDPLYVDNAPPEPQAVEVLNPTELRIVFNEPLDFSSVSDPAHFNLQPQVGNPLSASPDPQATEAVLLAFDQPFTDGTDYELTITGVADEVGNELGSAALQFTYLEILPADPYDVLIHEIMADPTPAVGLPQTEFIELYNASAKTIDLAGWSLASGGSLANIPSHVLAPGQYLLVCDSDDTDQLAVYGPVVGLSSFPALTNSGDDLALINASGQLVHQVVYSDDWYGSSQKRDGGWTLEMINPLAPCAGGSNWTAAIALTGGTPGAANSVADATPNTTGPRLQDVYPVDPQQLRLRFDRSLDSLAATQVASYRIEPALAIDLAVIDLVRRHEVVLFLAESLDSGVVYTLHPTDELTDCIGNAVSDSTGIRFGLTAIPAPGDLVINEILYEPAIGGSEFLEIFHRGSAPTDLSEVLLANLQQDPPMVTGLETEVLIFPGDHLVLTDSPADILERYTVDRPERLVRVDLPSLSNDGGNVSLLVVDATGTAVVIDSFDYEPDFHHPLLEETRGVSLERLRTHAATNLPANWHSAAETAGFATPTAANSQTFSLSTGDQFRLAHTTFSPDGDGYRDVLLIDYDLEEEGFLVNIRIFDTRGRLVRYVADNALAGRSGSFLWAGDSEQGDLVARGIYVVWIEYFHPDGRRMVKRYSCVLALTLD